MIKVELLKMETVERTSHLIEPISMDIYARTCEGMGIDVRLPNGKVL